MRENIPASSLKGARRSLKTSPTPPYGFCFLDGRLQKDPREYPTFQMIKEQSRRGKNPSEIARYLNGRKIKTRTGKAWKQPTVFYIVQRLKNKNTTSAKKESKV